MFDRIVVPLDLSPASIRALTTASRLGKGLDAPLELVTVSSPGIDPGGVREELRQVNACIDCRTLEPVALESNDVATTIDAHLSSHGRPLVCMATHGRTALGSVVLGSTADAILRVVATPVVLVGPRCRPPGAVGDVVVAVKPGDDARWTRAALPFAAAPFGTMHLVSAVDHNDAAARAVAADELRVLAKELSATGAAVCWRLVEGGDTHEAILRTAADVDASLVVLANPAQARSRRGLGHIGRHIVRTAPCPVLVVPSS